MEGAGGSHRGLKNPADCFSLVETPAAPVKTPWTFLIALLVVSIAITAVVIYLGVRGDLGSGVAGTKAPPSHSTSLLGIGVVSVGALPLIPATVAGTAGSRDSLGKSPAGETSSNTLGWWIGFGVIALVLAIGMTLWLIHHPI